jgi:hypothetical protein
MRLTIRAVVVLALLAAACGGGTDQIAADLGVAQCRPLARCGDTNHRYCANLSDDERNCGACGVQCSTGFACVGGECRYQCDPGLVACVNGAQIECANIATDRNNCGGCGIACSYGEACQNNTCVPKCDATAGLSACGPDGFEYCADLATDGANCGACGQQCPTSHSCVEGVCTLMCAPLDRCSDGGGNAYCVDTQTSAQNCGACGNVCADGRACIGGSCVLQCAAPLVACGPAGADTCVDLTSDTSCGACGNDCGVLGSNPGDYKCEQRTGGGYACAIQCGTLARCGAVGQEFCTDPATDDANCGACGNVCPGGTSCNTGSCACDAPTQNCPTLDGALNCVDKTTDPSNCGACGKSCNGIEACIDGNCLVPANLASYPMTKSFQDAIAVANSTLAYDGTLYWTFGYGTVPNYASYTRAGAFLQSYSTSNKFNSIFTQGGAPGLVYGRYASLKWIYKQAGAQTFSTVVQLTAPVLPATLANDSAIAMAPNGQYVSLTDGYVTTWDAAGKNPVSYQIASWGGVAGETVAPASRRMALAGDVILTYSNGTLSFFDRFTGVRLRTTVLEGAGTTADSHTSLSYSDGLVWIRDSAGGLWRGYAVGL